MNAILLPGFNGAANQPILVKLEKRLTPLGLTVRREALPRVASVGLDLAGDGVRAAMRAVDWSKTPVGLIETWPAALRTMISTLLHSRQPMFLWWGPELTQFYNDASLPSLGTGKHPRAMGQSGPECWPEIWSIIGPRVRDVMELGRPSWSENQLVPVNRNGRLEDVYWTSGYSPVFGDDGSIAGTLVVCTETTKDVLAAADVKHSADLLRLVTDALPVLISFVTADERYRMVNRAYEEWFGISRENILGRTVLEVIGPAAYATFSPAVKRALAGESFSFEQPEVPYRLGGPRDVKVSFVAHRNSAGAIDGYVALQQDISAERRLRLERERLAGFEQQLVGIVSHDLRDPLAAIQVGAALLSPMGDTSEKALKAIVRIQRSASRATRLVKDLLDFTQARAQGGIPVDLHPMDLNGCARAVVDELEAGYPERKIVLHTSGDGSVEWDVDRLAQVIQNLIGNALKYSPVESLVTVETSGPPTSSEVTLSVHNVGAPIRPEQLSSIFEPMTRGSGASHDQDRSVGLGLHIVRSIVSAHGGTVEVSSTPVNGTRFTVRLQREPRGAS